MRQLGRSDSAPGPWMVRFGQTMFNPIRLTDHVEAHRPRIGSVPVSRLLRKLDTVIGQDRVELERHGLKEVFKGLPGRLAIGFLDQLRQRKFAGPVDGHKEIELALFGPDLGNVDVEEAERVSVGICGATIEELVYGYCSPEMFFAYHHADQNAVNKFVREFDHERNTFISRGLASG
jgi:hypothetical protein